MPGGDDDNGNHANKHDGSGRLKKNMSKMAFRSKEMMLRTLGRTDETKDEIIDNYIHLVNKQQNQAQKFLRELKMYISSIHAMKQASANFYQSISSIYEDSWSGHDVISGLHQRSDDLYDQLHHKLNDVIINPLTLYSHQCNEIRVKVNKRGRKLVDFDAARRNYHQIQSAKKVDDVKLKKAKEQMNISGRKYEDLNAELHQQLPDLYDARVLLFANIVTDISTAENCFYGEMSEVRGKLLLMAETLKENFSHGKFHIQRLYSPKYPKEEVENNDAATLPCSDRLTSSDAASYRADDVTCEQGSPSNQESNYVNVITFPISSQSRDDDVTDDVTKVVADKMVENKKEKKASIAASRLTPSPPKSSPPDSVLDDEDTSDTSEEEPLNQKLPSQLDSPIASPSHDQVTKEVIEANDDKKQMGNNGILPPHYIYTVQAQHRYTGEDNDELSFEKNDVIYVVEFPDPDEQDEGWQMGVLKSAWDCDVSMATRGLFPENFTKKI